MIIIETTTRERLVLVPEKQIVCTTHTRDATPEDLARGGFVLREQAAPGTLAHLRADLRDMTARAELARLTAPAEGEPTGMVHALTYRPDTMPERDAMDAYRLGVAHERARQQPAQDRATAEELERVYSAAYARAWESEVSTPDRGERAGVLAVAARVRQERCLVAQAVDAHMSMHVYRRGHDGWAVALGPRFVECEPADVPATLARLLGEVERG